MRDSKVRVYLPRAKMKTFWQSQMAMDAVMDEAEAIGDVETSFVGFDRVQVIVKRNEDVDRAES